ncbi:MAG: type II toxin-antitoxin system prevent-host-death family antitoxin [Actinobacteria bacterium]|nr:type II toxin-antitoxin system prevent-host-death family antitoxin [Actinomycetota bacterium]
MTTISQRVLSNHVGEILRRVEAGETFTVTVGGRPVAELGPVHRRCWVSGPALARIWHGPAPRVLDDDLAQLAADLTDPFGRKKA